MNAKDKNKKTSCPENKLVLPITHKVMSYVVEKSESLVKKVKSGKRNNKSETGQQIELAEKLLKEGSNALIEEVKRMVKL